MIKKILCAFVVTIGLSGCAGSRSTYKAVLVWPGASAAELDQLVAAGLSESSEVMLLRTVSWSGAVEVFVRSELAKEAVEQWVRSGDLSENVKLASVMEVRRRLPDVPEVNLDPRLVIRFDREKAQALGVAASDFMGVSQFKAEDFEAARNFVIETGDGKQVKLTNVAEVVLEKGPSHIVRDY